MKNILSAAGRVTAALLCIVMTLTLLPAAGAGETAYAAEYGSWSEWSETKPESSSTREIETRSVPRTTMIMYVTQEAASPYYREFRSYSVNGNYSAYKLRSSYGEFYYHWDVTDSQLAAATSYPQGSMVGSGNVEGYQKGNGDSYQIPGNAYASWFKGNRFSVTEYRYRDQITSGGGSSTGETSGGSAGTSSGGTTGGSSGTSSGGSSGSSSGTSSGSSSSGIPAQIMNTVPVIVTGICSFGGVQITWKSVSHASGYYVYRGSEKIATIDRGSTLNYTDTGAKTNGKKYSYQVQAYYKNGSSIVCSKKSVLVIVIFIKITPVKTCRLSGDNSVSLKWTKNSKCSGYEIYYSTSSDFSNYRRIWIKGCGRYKYTLKKLKMGTKYYIMIRCWFKSGGKYYYSAFTRSCSVTTKSPSYTRKGVILDAQTGRAIPRATLYFRSGSNKRSGKIYCRSKTNSKGQYKVTLREGTYTVEIRRSGYCVTYIIIIVSSSSKSYSSNTDCLSKKLKSAQYRVVLTWGSSPRDLDSYLTGPSGTSSSRFRVCYYNKSGYYNGKTIADLDRDDRDWYGPETVTLNLNLCKNGTYNYYVHDYTNKSSSSSTALGNSGARVTIYRGSRQIASYKVPKKEGTCWSVFMIKNGKIIKRNKMSYVSYGASLD